MLSFKTAYNALQLVIQSTLDAMNAATKFKAQGLFVHHVHLETMFFKREANASRWMDVHLWVIKEFVSTVLLDFILVKVYALYVIALVPHVKIQVSV